MVGTIEAVSVNIAQALVSKSETTGRVPQLRKDKFDSIIMQIGMDNDSRSLERQHDKKGTLEEINVDRVGEDKQRRWMDHASSVTHTNDECLPCNTLTSSKRIEVNGEFVGIPLDNEKKRRVRAEKVRRMSRHQPCYARSVGHCPRSS